MNQAHIFSLPWVETHSPARAPLVLQKHRPRPGESPCPFHRHAVQWELFLILEGQARVRAESDTHSLVAGDVVLHPPGEAHQITNSGDSDLLFYIIADNPLVDYCYYPDSEKWGFRSPRKFFRASEVDLWEGEE
jgi:uncharacterized cupin superfamily protein